MNLYVSVKKETLANNLKFNRNDPPFEIRTSKKDTNPTAYNEISFTGKITFKYDKENPLCCGAVAWVEIEPIGE